LWSSITGTSERWSWASHKARARLKALALLRDDGAHFDVVRDAQYGAADARRACEDAA